MEEIKETEFFENHRALGAKLVEFAGYDVPVLYTSILEEHLATRKGAGLFDISHMGRFIVKGRGALPFLQHVLTNNAQAIVKPESGAQYTFIATETGGALDDAYLNSDIIEDEELTVDIRGKKVEAVVVPYHMRSESPPYVRPILFDHDRVQRKVETGAKADDALGLLEKSAANTQWRQQTCIHLIPSEMSPSPLVRMLSIMDPYCRYAEHKKVKAYYDTEVFYYQGTDFIDQVEALLVQELKEYFGCAEVETRLISGQLANTAVFSAMVDYINQADRKKEQRRIGKVMNNHIGKGGHLSAKPMGALRDFV